MSKESKRTLPPIHAAIPSAFIGDIRRMIEETRSAVAVTVNAGLTMLNWRLGRRIRQEILKGKRSGYGKEILATLSRELTRDYGKGFSYAALARMVQFAEAFPDELVKKELAALRDEDRLSPDLVFRDPYLLDFLGLADTWSEDDLEAAILRELERFLLELGVGFAFVARQKRMTIDGEDFHLDLLFLHRRLRRLVAIELKMGKFKAEYKGKMELYLRWLEEHEMQPGEEPPLGLILCAEGNREQIQLLRLDASGIHIAEYLTEFPSKEILKKKLHHAIRQAKAQLEHRTHPEDMQT